MVSEDDLSDQPCPLGCGFRPWSALSAAVHLAGHVIDTHRTGEEQMEDLQGGAAQSDAAENAA